MTEQEISNLLATYTLRATSGRRQDGSTVFFAWYDELPGCMVEAASRPEALSELDAIAPAILDRLDREGLQLPAAITARGPRELTNTLLIDGLLVGTPVAGAVATVEFSATQTTIEHDMADAAA